MTILSLDPSGNFKHGKGTTGIAIMEYDTNIKSGKIMCNSIRAKDYDSNQEFIQMHINVLKIIKPDVVVVENYKVQTHKGLGQQNKENETSELIGIIRQYCYDNKIEYVLQNNTIKSRWNDIVLDRELRLLFTVDIKVAHNIHERDALRHLLEYYMIKFELYDWQDVLKGKWN